MTCTGFGSINISDLIPRALRLLLGLLVAGDTVPMGVASLSDEGCRRTAGSGKINSCGICEAFTNDLRLNDSTYLKLIKIQPYILNTLIT